MAKTNNPLEKTRSRKWHYRISNPTEDDLKHMQVVPAVVQHICGYETMNKDGEKTTPHLQGFIEFKHAKTMSAVKKAMNNNGVHLERPLGTDYDNWVYCTKEGTIVAQVGDFPPQPTTSKHADWEDAHEHFKHGKDMMSLIEAKPHMTRYISALRSLQAEHHIEGQVPWRQLTTTYISGSAGCGKSSKIQAKYGHENVYRITDKRNPWDSYRGQPVVVFEEYRSNFGIENMLNWLDGYPIMLPCRYVNRPAQFTKVFILTNIPLQEQFVEHQENFPETWGAFLRRIDSVIEGVVAEEDDHVYWIDYGDSRTFAERKGFFNWLHHLRGDKKEQGNDLGEFLPE